MQIVRKEKDAFENSATSEAAPAISEASQWQEDGSSFESAKPAKTLNQIHH
jgi:hypothetical protein